MPGKIKNKTVGRVSVLSPRAAPFIERAPLPIVEVQGAKHLVTYVNSAFCNLLEKPKKDLIGKPFAKIVHKGEECLPILNRVYQTGEAAMLAKEDELESSRWLYAMWPALDEKKRPTGVIIHLSKVPKLQENLADVNEALLVAGLRQHKMTEEAEQLSAQLRIEIAERKRIEQALREAQIELKEHALTLERTVHERTADLKLTNEQLASFVYSIAHDLRAPLRAMQGFSQLLMDDYAASLDETPRSFLIRIKASAEFMDKMIMDLLAFGAGGRGDDESNLNPVKVQAAWDAALYQYATTIEKTKAHVETVTPLPSVRANQVTLTQVLANLLSNAIKFVPEGTQPQLRFWAEDRGDRVRLWLQDNGVGIQATHQERIFRVFERLNGGRFTGTGIGLSIVRQGVERMGGKTGLESEPGKGSRFWIELPKA